MYSMFRSAADFTRMHIIITRAYTMFTYMYRVRRGSRFILYGFCEGVAAVQSASYEIIISSLLVTRKVHGENREDIISHCSYEGDRGKFLARGANNFPLYNII